MAAELPYASSDPNHKPKAAAAAAATTNRRRVSWSTVGMLVFMAFNFAVSVSRVQDDRGEVAFVCVSHLNLALLFGALRWFEVAPEGSPARVRIRRAVWLLSTTLTAVFTWKIGEMLPLGPAIVAWVAAAATVGGGFYVVFPHEDEKPSESLIMRDCERDEKDLLVLAS